jgi:hypothetical protein
MIKHLDRHESHSFASGITFRLCEENIFIMNSILYTIAVVLIILWALGFFMYSASGLIHVLLVIAIIAVLVRVIKGGRL